MASDFNEKKSLVIVIGSPENGSEFTWIERHDPMSGITLLYLRSYRASEGGRRSLKEAIQAPNYV